MTIANRAKYILFIVNRAKFVVFDISITLTTFQKVKKVLFFPWYK